jgi:hypothetical protein
MPKRSTPFQAIVHLVRRDVAQPGVTVTESKFLRDAVLGIEREVDIVIEGEFDGEPVTLSIEVIEHKRRASLTWVEQIIAKHRNLPTNRLLLISRSGFTPNALAAIAQEGGRVQALQPEFITDDGQPVIRHLFAEAINYDPTSCNVHLHPSGDERIIVAGAPDTDIYAADGSLLGPLTYLVRDAVNSNAVRQQLSFEAYTHPEEEQVKAFSLNLLIGQLGYHLQHTETGNLHLIEGLEIWGNFAISRTEIALTLTSLGGRIYGAGEATIAGHPTVWVGTTDLVAKTTTISWQATSQQESLTLNQPSLFPGLLALLESQAPRPNST